MSDGRHVRVASTLTSTTPRNDRVVCTDPFVPGSLIVCRETGDVTMIADPRVGLGRGSHRGRNVATWRMHERWLHQMTGEAWPASASSMSRRGFRPTGKSRPSWTVSPGIVPRHTMRVWGRSTMMEKRRVMVECRREVMTRRTVMVRRRELVLMRWRRSMIRRSRWNTVTIRRELLAMVMWRRWHAMLHMWRCSSKRRRSGSKSCCTGRRGAVWAGAENPRISRIFVIQTVASTLLSGSCVRPLCLRHATRSSSCKSRPPNASFFRISRSFLSIRMESDLPVAFVRTLLICVAVDVTRSVFCVTLPVLSRAFGSWLDTFASFILRGD
mmetsp:Transcript_52651/g.127644  ORF Transcript_52651/g.127644 Transcript_52651/m.127644 type:complete len:327 (+) Transcript_52651:1608-2588(+)